MVEIKINKRTTEGQLARDSASFKGQLRRAGFLLSVSFTCFLALLLLTQFFHSASWQLVDPSGNPWDGGSVFFVLMCFTVVLIGCPVLLNNRMAEQQLEGTTCLTLPAFSLPTVLMASLVPLPLPRTLILSVGVFCSGIGFYSVLSQPRTADRSTKTYLMFEVYRFCVPTALVIFAVWRWSNADIDPSFSQRYWITKLLFGCCGYAAAFVTGSSYLVHSSRITPAGAGPHNMDYPPKRWP